MIDKQKLHHAAATLFGEWRICAHAHSFAHVLGAGNLRTRHPVDHWFTVSAELRPAIGPEFRHAHLNQTHSAIARRTQLFVIAITRHVTAGLRARLDHTRAFRKLTPHAIDLDV